MTISKIVKCLLMMLAIILTILSLRYYFIIESQFKDSFPILLFIFAVLLFISAMGFALKNFALEKIFNGVCWLLVSISVFISFSYPATYVIRQLAAKNLIKNNPDLIKTIKKQKQQLYFLDDAKEVEALFYDSEAELIKKKKEVSVDWLSRHPSFKFCSYWAIPIEKDIYIVTFHC